MRIIFTLAAGFAFAVAAIGGETVGEPAGTSRRQEPPSRVAPGAVPAATDSSRVLARELPARIMEFTAEPSEIAAGEPVTLIWATENPSGVAIEPGLGRVTPRGSRQLFPSATTTYTLTLGGPNDQVVTRDVTVTVPGTVPVTAESAPGDTAEAPRTPAGRPDLSGVYDFRGPPAAGGGRGGRGGAGPVLRAGAEGFRVVRGPTDTGATSDCMPLIGPRAFGTPYQFQIVQNANHMVILYEYPGTFRVIPIDGRPHEVDPDPSWLGDSVGRWEGDTLVVATIGFNEETEIEGYRHTGALRIVERFSRPEHGYLRYEATIEDPNVFERPFTRSRDFALRPDLVRIAEFICENNRDYSSLFGVQ